MDSRTDILLDDEFDIIDKGDEWAEGESDDQHVQLILLTNKGEIREFPHCGFGIEQKLRQRTNAQQFLRGVEIELDNDGYTDAKIITGKTIGDFKVQLGNGTDN